MPVVQRTWTINGRLPIAPGVILDQAIAHDLPTDWRGIVNGIYVPRGREAGEANFLVPGSYLAGLESSASEIVCEHENGRTVWPGWYLEESKATTKQRNPAYWVRLRDVRFLLEQSSSEGRRFNYRRNKYGDSRDWVPGTVNGSTPWTWQQVLDQLWSYLPAEAGGAPSLPISPASTPENLCFDGMSTWRAINQVLTAIGCAAVLNPFTGEITYIYLKNDDPGLDGALSQLFNQGRLLWNNDSSAGDYVLPSGAGILYPRLPPNVAWFPFLARPQYVETSGVGGIQGVHELVDTTFFWSGRDVSQRNSEIDNALAGLLHPFAFPRYAEYSGVSELAPSSRLTGVTWVSDGTHGMTTKIDYCGSNFDWPQMPDYANLRDTVGVIFELNEPLNRGAGETAQATVLETSDTDTVEVDAIISVLNTGDMLGLPDARGVAILVGGQWWVVVLDQQSLLATFEFYERSHASGSQFGVDDQNVGFAINNFQSLTPYPFGDNLEITINNPYNLIGLVGDTGLCAYNVDTNEYTLIKVFPLKTRRFYFELSADWPNGLNQTSTNATLLYPDPTHQGGDVDWATITLRDRFNVAPNAKGAEGTKDVGICQFNYDTAEFDILEISHQFRIGRGSVYASFAGKPDSFLVDGVIGFDGRVPAGPTLTVYNELGVESLNADDLVEIRWNTIAGRYYALLSGNGGGSIKYCKLAEDAIGDLGRAYVYAKRATLNVTTSAIELDGDFPAPFKLYQWQFILSSPKYAKAGYPAIYSIDDKGRMVFVNGPCITGCQADGAIDLEIPDGEVGTPYSHTVVGTDVDDTTIDATNLPPGLSFNGTTNVISGTPTTAGEYLVTLTATSDNGCLITNIVELTIAPEG